MTKKPVPPPDLWAQLDALWAAQRPSISPEGEGWFTPKEYGDRNGIHVGTAKRRLYALFQAGKLERWEGGANGNAAHYRLKGSQ